MSMFDHIIATLQGSDPAPVSSKRRAERRSSDACVSVIQGKTYPVENWSTGGVLLFGDSKAFGLNNEVDVTLKFKLRDKVIDVAHRGRVVRKTYDRVALEFAPINKKMRDAFQSVIDDHVASQFVDSQLV